MSEWGPPAYPLRRLVVSSCELALECRQLFDESVVDVAVTPRLVRLVRANDRMPGFPMMGGRMLARRVVAAADVPALEAEAQMHPNAARGEAFAATVTAWSNAPFAPRGARKVGAGPVVVGVRRLVPMSHS